MADMIPAAKAYKEFGIPRSLLRELAERGIVRAEKRSFDGGANFIVLYSVSDIAKWQNGGEQ